MEDIWTDNTSMDSTDYSAYSASSGLSPADGALRYPNFGDLADDESSDFGSYIEQPTHGPAATAWSNDSYPAGTHGQWPSGMILTGESLGPIADYTPWPTDFSSSESGTFASTVFAAEDRQVSNLSHDTMLASSQQHERDQSCRYAQGLQQQDPLAAPNFVSNSSDLVWQTLDAPHESHGELDPQNGPYWMDSQIAPGYLTNPAMDNDAYFGSQVAQMPTWQEIPATNLSESQSTIRPHEFRSPMSTSSHSESNPQHLNEALSVHRSFSGARLAPKPPQELEVTQVIERSSNAKLTGPEAPDRRLTQRTTLGSMSVASPESTSSAQESDRISISSKAQRDHAWYFLPPRSDGYYVCPVSDCKEESHQIPTKLKCNYDKWIDSHIKPFRCHKQGCEDIAFSSTACRLRHERESHGWHGHGLNPYPCEYEHCDRSRSDNAFPRAFNQRDHMKRMHGWRPPTSTASRRRATRKSKTQRETRPAKRTKSTAASSSSVMSSPQESAYTYSPMTQHQHDANVQIYKEDVSSPSQAWSGQQNPLESWEQFLHLDEMSKAPTGYTE